MNLELQVELDTLKELVLLRAKLEDRIANTLPEIRQQISDLQVTLDDATLDDRAELLAATQYEEQVRERVVSLIDAMWQERWAELLEGKEVPAADFPAWLTVMRVQSVEITDENLIPVEYRSIDLKKLKAAGVDVPGSRVTVKPSIKVMKGKIK